MLKSRGRFTPILFESKIYVFGGYADVCLDAGEW